MGDPEAEHSEYQSDDQPQMEFDHQAEQQADEHHYQVHETAVATTLYDQNQQDPYHQPQQKPQGGPQPFQQQPPQPQPARFPPPQPNICQTPPPQHPAQFPPQSPQPHQYPPQNQQFQQGQQLQQQPYHQPPKSPLQPRPVQFSPYHQNIQNNPNPMYNNNNNSNNPAAYPPPSPAKFPPVSPSMQPQYQQQQRQFKGGQAQADYVKPSPYFNGQASQQQSTYPSQGVPMRGPQTHINLLNIGTEQWSSELFDCMNDPMNAVTTALVPCITFGQIAEVVDSGTSSCMMSGLFYGAVASLTAAPFIMSCTYRTKLRSRFGLMESPAPDWMVHFLCEPCALCQEYRELQYRGLDPAIGWIGNEQRKQMQPNMMMPPGNQNMNQHMM